MSVSKRCSKYFIEGGFRAWRDKQCCVLLSSAQFAPGLQVCDGVAYPVQIEVIIEVENRHVGVSPFCRLGGRSFLVDDEIQAQAQVNHK